MVVIDGDKIAAIRPSGGLKSEDEVAYTAVIDASGKIIMPGLINAHMHFYSTFARGLSKAKVSANFNQVLENLWWRLDKKLTLEDCRVSAEVALIEAIRKGTTTLIDHHSSPSAVRGSLEAVGSAVKISGLRASLCFEVSDRNGDKAATEAMAENTDFINACKKENHPQLKALFGLHASFTVSDNTFRAAVTAGGKLDSGFHVHTAEAQADQEHSLKTHGMRVVERFKQHGLLGPKTICAHCVHVNEAEIDILADTGTNVVCNPQSNMNNAVGAADIVAMQRRGVTVGLGTDAMTLNMLEEMRSSIWLQKFSHADPSSGFKESFNSLTLNNAKISNQYWNFGLGEIKEGSAADIVLVDYVPPTPLNQDSLAGHFCFGIATSTIDTTIVGGRVLMKNKVLCNGMDEERVCARARELATRLWDRF